MFRKSSDSQGDLFSGILGQLGIRKQKLLEDASSWHNVFYKELYQRIDEGPYAVLYHKNNGRPNASVRQMICMMILKEGHGWSDEQLFERCRFDIKTLLALGNSNFDDSIPTESTYYEFRRLLGAHNTEQKEDLLKATFASITSSQVRAFEISGKKIRMDSKLINSNIATSNRLHLILEATRKFVKIHSNKIDIESLGLESSIQEILESLGGKTTSNILYSLNGKKKKETLLQLGILIKSLLAHTKGSKHASYYILERIYKEQYKEQEDGEEDGEDQSPQLKEPKEIPSSSVQSIHDPEATYRTKGNGASKQTVQGFHANITESCDPQDAVNLILDVEVVPANISEDAFLEAAMDNSESLLQQAHQSETKQIQEVITDGGYDNIETRQDMLKEQRPTWKMAKTKGGKAVYEIGKTEQGDYRIVHISTGVVCKVDYSKKSKKYIIHNPSGSKRYMSNQEIKNYINRQEIESNSDQESYNLRANVEATIHQTFHRIKKRGKIVYRGQIKCLWYVITRALWVNMTRIKAKTCLNDLRFSILVAWAFIVSVNSKKGYQVSTLILSPVKIQLF